MEKSLCVGILRQFSSCHFCRQIVFFPSTPTLKKQSNYYFVSNKSTWLLWHIRKKNLRSAPLSRGRWLMRLISMRDQNTSFRAAIAIQMERREIRFVSSNNYFIPPILSRNCALCLLLYTIGFRYWAICLPSSLFSFVLFSPLSLSLACTHHGFHLHLITFFCCSRYSSQVFLCVAKTRWLINFR